MLPQRSSRSKMLFLRRRRRAIPLWRVQRSQWLPWKLSRLRPSPLPRSKLRSHLPRQRAQARAREMAAPKGHPATLSHHPAREASQRGGPSGSLPFLLSGQSGAANASGEVPAGRGVVSSGAAGSDVAEISARAARRSIPRADAVEQVELGGAAGLEHMRPRPPDLRSQPRTEEATLVLPMIHHPAEPS